MRLRVTITLKSFMIKYDETDIANIYFEYTLEQMTEKEKEIFNRYNNLMQSHSNLFKQQFSRRRVILQ